MVDKRRCAKQTVVALIVTKKGEHFIGSNWCENPQESCPRGDLPTGVGYELCLAVCGQKNHAEVDACTKAGEKAKGGTLFLIGHTYCCEDCKKAIKASGIVETFILT